MMTAVEIRAAAQPPTWTRSSGSSGGSYPTPWSRSMFAGELAKPNGICLGAFQGDDMLGYLIVARYVDAWHVMNIAVDAAHRGRGVARALLEELFELTDGRRRARLHAGGARHPTTAAIQLYRSLGFVETGITARLLHRQPRGRPDHVARDAA